MVIIKVDLSGGNLTLEFEKGSTRIYRCPICQVDTPHSIRGQRGETYAVLCTNCEGGALVNEDDLRLYQLRWEEELREILDSLERETTEGGYEDI